MILPLLHTEHPFTWDAWHFEPTVFAGIWIAGSLYVYALMRLLDGGVHLSRSLLLRAGSFFTGLLVMLVALLSPIDAGAGFSFAFHMLQHVLLATIGPPLMVIGIVGLLREGLRLPSLLSLFRNAVHPLIAAPLFVVNMWIWHIPPVYDLAVSELAPHITMHLCYIGTGFIYWIPVIGTLRRGDFALLGQLFYLFFSGFPMMILALLLLASSNPLYDAYSNTEIPFGMSRLTDQQVGGLVMGGLGEVAAFIAFTVVVLRVLKADEEANRATGSVVQASEPSALSLEEE